MINLKAFIFRKNGVHFVFYLRGKFFNKIVISINIRKVILREVIREVILVNNDNASPHVRFGNNYTRDGGQFSKLNYFLFVSMS